MIKPMRRVQVVVREDDRERLLNKLADLGVLHVTPVNPDRAIPGAEIATELDNVRRAVQMLSSIEPQGEAPEISLQELVAEALSIQRAQAEQESRLTTLYRQLEQQEIWGEVTIDDLEQLKAAGVGLSFYKLPKELVSQVRADVVEVLGEVGKKEAIVAVIDRSGTTGLPDKAELIPEPSKDNPTIRGEAAEIDARRREGTERLAQLANSLEEITRFQMELEARASFSAVANSGVERDELYAIEGWVPAERYERLVPQLEDSGIMAAAREFEPSEDETPPTLIGYPKWALPIKGLFDMLNTLPGYREIDLSVFFMIAMPIFAAMLAGDAGYGIVFMLPVILMRRRVLNLLGREGTRLLFIFGLVTLIWGVLSANFFGVKPDAIADIMPLERGTDDATQKLLIQISFLMGTVHLVTAHIRRSMAILPDSRGVADIGWSIVLLAMLGLIWLMIFEYYAVPKMIIIAALFAGIAMVALFASPHRNPLKRVGVGFASSILPLISTFSDTMSYIRLMAVGLASYYIAFAFNDLGSTVAGSATWAAAAPIVVFGHLLNIILIIIAIFAHGVRLNMLEFSNNAGVQWSGYPYNPFTKTTS